MADTRKMAKGTSASTTPGTAIASLSATAGSQLIAIEIGYNSAGSASGATVTFTYTDDTTATWATLGSNVAGLWAGISGFDDGNALQSLDGVKKVKSIAAVTTGTGSGVRTIAISALEVPI